MTVTLNNANAHLFVVERVSMKFGNQKVLRDIDLNVERGESIVIIGESGCGKTVLLKLLIGLLQPTAGRVLFDGRDLARLGEAALTEQRMRIGFLFQGAALFDSLTVYDNVAFGLRQTTRRPEREIRDGVLQGLHEVGLRPDVASKKPSELSGGMRKRVGLARALAMNPEVMMYDEPTTGLDPVMSDVINELIVQTRNRHSVTSIVVTHDMKTVHRVASRVVMLYPVARLRMDDAQILYDGSAKGLEQCTDSRVKQFVDGEGEVGHVRRMRRFGPAW